MRIIWSHSILNWLYGEAISYPTPTSLSFFWSFGVMALVCLISQIASGIFLAMHYIPSAELAFTSVEHIMRDVRGGWFLRYLHANGASMFFLVVYLHISWGIYYGSFAGKRQFVWYSGVVILFLMILTAFLGYVLPWGQMSFWAATVITSLASAIPLVGDIVVAWLWGGFSVGEQTLVRFFSLHYLLPFILFALVAAHIVLLHETGSNTPTGVSLNWGDRITFGPYFFLKDLYFLVLFFFLFMYFIFFNSNYLGHPDNYIPAMYMSTPAHIVPEWYFLPFYALLRSVPNKLGGVIVMLLSIIALAVLPVLLNTTSKRFILNTNFNIFRSIFFSLFLANSILLGWIGGQPIEEPMYTVGQGSSTFYFFLVFTLFPIMNWILANELKLVDHFVWWEEVKFLFSEFSRVLWMFAHTAIRYSHSYHERWDAGELYWYIKGVHPLFPIDESDKTIERNSEGYYKNVMFPRVEFMIQGIWDENRAYFDKKLDQIDFIVANTNATPASENIRTAKTTSTFSELKLIFVSLIPDFVGKIFTFIFPKSTWDEELNNTISNVDLPVKSYRPDDYRAQLHSTFELHGKEEWLRGHYEW